MAKYVLFDTETTGAAEEDRVIQVGAMVVGPGRDEVVVYDELCLAPIPIKLEAMEVHNITPDLLVGKPAYGETEFKTMLDGLNTPDNFLIAHNINFDHDMIKKEGFENKMQMIDTLRCSRHLLDQPHNRLQYLRYALGLYKGETAEAQKHNIEIKAHDAIGDVLVMKLLFSHLLVAAKQKFPEDNNPITTLVKLTATPVLMKMFKFGKHKGKEIAEVAKTDRGYLTWMQGNMELDEDMAYTLNHYLSGQGN